MEPIKVGDKVVGSVPSRGIGTVTWVNHHNQKQGAVLWADGQELWTRLDLVRRTS